MYKDLQQLAPFGAANPSPVIKLTGTQKGVRLFGDKKQHIEINVDGVSCVTFNVSDQKRDRIINSDNWLGYLEKDTFKGGVKLKLI